MSELTIAMSRSANQPWGFRLHGGVDFSSALTVLKVSFCLVDLFPLFPPHCCLFEICTSPFNWLIVMLGQLMLSARKGWFFFFFWLFFLWILGRTWVKRFVWFGLVWFGLVFSIGDSREILQPFRIRRFLLRIADWKWPTWHTLFMALDSVISKYSLWPLFCVSDISTLFTGC